MANIDLGNLTRYDGKIKQYAEDKYLSKNTANWQMTEKAGAVTCYPVPDTELEPIVDFSFKEIPPASGDKSPSNPSTIEGVSSITLTRCGKNILPYPYYETTLEKNGIIWTKNTDGTVTANGTVSTVSVFWLMKDPLRISSHQRVTVSGCPSGGSFNTYGFTYGTIKGTYSGIADYGSTGYVEGITDYAYISPSLRIAGNITVSDLVFKPQIEYGNIATEFEKYEGNIYTYSLGNTYYGGSINLATGMLTMTHAETTLTGTEVWGLSSDSTESISIFGASSVLNYAPEPAFGGVCTHIPLYSGPIALNSFRVYTNKAVILRLSATDFPTEESLKTWLQAQNTAGTPVKITYTLATPQIIQLTPVQIKSLFALDKNTPRLNTLYTDADSIQVGYQKHPARTAYELENAILALGGGE